MEDKEKMIDTLFEEFEKDKEVIKKNLLYVMDFIVLEVENESGKKITLTIDYKKEDNNVRTNYN